MLDAKDVSLLEEPLLVLPHAVADSSMLQRGTVHAQLVPIGEVVHKGGVRSRLLAVRAEPRCTARADRRPPRLRGRPHERTIGLKPLWALDPRLAGPGLYLGPEFIRSRLEEATRLRVVHVLRTLGSEPPWRLELGSKALSC